MEPGEIIGLQRATVDEHIRQECAHNWPGVHDTFVQDESAFYDVVPFNSRFSGFSGVKDFYRAIEMSFPDFEVTVWGEYDVPGCSIRELTISASHKGEWCGLAATGRHARLHAAVFYLFCTGEQAAKLLAERVYFDNDNLMQQLRGEFRSESVADFSKTQIAGAV
jgi:predicted ester cyclase